jgi:hypothetical protein
MVPSLGKPLRRNRDLGVDSRSLTLSARHIFHASFYPLPAAQLDLGARRSSWRSSTSRRTRLPTAASARSGRRDRGRARWSPGRGLLDIGGESTRPGAAPLPAERSSRASLPVLEGCAAGRRADFDRHLQAAVAERAIELGATIVNDISA